MFKPQTLESKECFRRALAGLALAGALCGGAVPADYCVSTTGDDSRTKEEARSPSTPWRTIQHAIDMSEEADTVCVMPGTYEGKLLFDGDKTMTVQSSDPDDWSVVESTIIKPGHNSVRFANGNDSTLSGFTITGGSGIYCTDSTPTIYRNIVSYNWPGITCENSPALIESNIIYSNERGINVLDCSPLIRNNILLYNYNSFGGGANEMFCTGDSDPIIIHTTVYGCFDLMIKNESPNKIKILNSIIWPGGVSNCFLANSCIETTGDLNLGTVISEGVIHSDPLFWDPPPLTIWPYYRSPSDLFLRPDSPCIDAGGFDAALPETDITGKPRTLYGGKDFRPDMGAFEYRINRVRRTTAGNLELEWSSLEGKSYPIFWSEDLVSWNVLGIVPSRGNATTVFELPEPTGARRFYRVNEE